MILFETRKWIGEDTNHGQSCQGYITSLQELAKQNGKIIEFNITAQPETTSISKLKEFLNQ